jgi:hypothetical protein
VTPRISYAAVEKSNRCFVGLESAAMSAANSSDLPVSTFPAPDSAAPAALGEVQAPSNGQDIEMSDAISDGTVALNEAKAAVDADGKAVDIEEDVEPLDTEPTTSGLPHGMSKFNFIMLFVGYVKTSIFVPWAPDEHLS